MHDKVKVCDGLVLVVDYQNISWAEFKYFEDLIFSGLALRLKTFMGKAHE
jgi:hypothetical protein